MRNWAMIIGVVVSCVFTISVYCYAGAQVNLLFTTPEADPVVRLEIDKKGSIFALTTAGNLWQFEAGKEPVSLATGLKKGNFSCRYLTVGSDDELIVGDGISKDKNSRNDIVLKINQKGNQTKLKEFESESLLSATTTGANNIYLGYWGSEGNISVSMKNFTCIDGADHLYGKVILIGKEQKSTNIFEGGLPMALASNNKGEVFAAIWGKKGALRPDGNYSICDPRHSFWIYLSDKVEIRRIVPSDDKGGGLINNEFTAVSSMAVMNNTLYIYGTKNGNCGIYRMQTGAQPEMMSLPDEKLNANITALAASEDNLYFSNTAGKIYQINPSMN